jgi:hypothetical protein
MSPLGPKVTSVGLSNRFSASPAVRRLPKTIFTRQFGFLAGVLIANDDDMPQWNPCDEFADERQTALQALK